MTDASADRFFQIRTFLFRAFCIYLLLYFLFISDFASNYPVLWHVNAVFVSLSNAIGLALNKAFFSPDFKEWRFFDSYWTYSKLAAFLILGILGAAIWTAVDKGKKLPGLFKYAYAFSRYYLAIGTLLYSMWKLFETQFYLELKNFLLPMHYNGPRALFWTFMASSRSYSIFGGIVEATAVVFLLFRKTTTLGALIALGVLVNILVMDAAYDTPVKVIVFHLLLCNIVVLWPDTVKLFRFFVLKQTETLSSVPPLVSNEKYKKAGWVVKTVFIALVILPMVKAGFKDYNKLYHSYYETLVGIHEIETSFKLPGSAGQSLKAPDQWKKFTLEEGNLAHVLLANDSISEYTIRVDTAAKSFGFASADSGFTNSLHYLKIDSTHWLFEGRTGSDSVRFITRQIDIHRYPLLKENGKIIWSWITPP